MHFTINECLRGEFKVDPVVLLQFLFAFKFLIGKVLIDFLMETENNLHKNNYFIQCSMTVSNLIKIIRLMLGLIRRGLAF